MWETLNCINDSLAQLDEELTAPIAFSQKVSKRLICSSDSHAVLTLCKQIFCLEFMHCRYGRSGSLTRSWHFLQSQLHLGLVFVGKKLYVFFLNDTVESYGKKIKFVEFKFRD